MFDHRYPEGIAPAALPEQLQAEQERLIAAEQQRQSDDWWAEFTAQAVALGLLAGLAWWALS